MKYLYYCNSAYQLLNAINLHYNRKFNYFENIKDYSGDILLLDVFDGAKEIYKIIKSNNLFDRTFIGKRFYRQGRMHLIQNIIDILCPAKFIYEANGIKKDEIYDKYDYIVVPKFSTVTAAIWSMNKHAKLQLYEDGIGAYHTYQLEPNSKSYKILYKHFNYGRTFYDYECLYLNKPSLYVGPSSNKIKQMPTLDTNKLNELANLFKDFSFNNNKKIIWFDQYINDDVNETTENVLKDYKDSVLYCTHPRHPKDLKEFDKPKNSYIWEIACLGINDINKKCLLTIHSTAVFTPKLLYDYEPYIIFKIKLLSGYKNKEKDAIEKFKVIEDFKKMYSNPSKIMVPETIEEYRECVANFINKK